MTLQDKLQITSIAINFAIAIITAIYVYATIKMVGVMKKQVVSEIKLSNIKLTTSLNNEFIAETKKITKQTRGLSFHLSFDIYNSSSGNGAIEKPMLKIMLNELPFFARPTTKTFKGDISTGQNFEIIDLGGGIFMPGGDYKKVEISYDYFEDENNLFYLLIEQINKKATINEDDFKYSIVYKDNIGKRYEKKITSIEHST
jgi:hypothetical protein